MDEPTRKSALLMLAENYYTVAAHLRESGERQLQVAEMLAKIADGMCEQNIRETSPPSASPEPK